MTSVSKIKKNRNIKHLLSTAALCIALHGPVLAAETTITSQSAPVEATLHTAFDQLIADSKTQMMRDPANALDLATNAENLARTSSEFKNRNTSIATAMWLRGESLMRVGKPEKAQSVIQNALDLIDQDVMATKLGGDLLLAHGRSAGRASDVKTAVKSYFKAHEVFVNTKQPRSEAMALMAIGSVYRDAQAYDQAMEYYQRASEVYTGDANLNLASYNNQANILKETEQFSKARELFQQAFEIAEKMDSTVLKARILTNEAELEVLDGDFAKADTKSTQALALLDGDENTEWKRFVFGTQAHAKLQQNDIVGAAALIKDAFDGMDITDTSMSYEEMHDVAYQVFLKRGEHELALKHHQSFKRLSDNAKKIAASANLALLGAKFHSSERELQIQRLKNEQLAQDMALESADRQMTVQVAIISLGALVLLFLLAAMATLRKHRDRMAKVNEQLTESVDQLNKEIVRRKTVEKDLVEAKDKAEEANRMKSTFLATMSHELRTPMNGILGFSRILQDTKLDDEQRSHIGIIEQSGKALLGLINDILDLSQIEAGKLSLTEDAFNLRATIEDSVKLLEPTAQQKGLNLAVQIDPDLPATVNGDADRIRQIIVNLAGNAVKFTENGSVAVTVNAGENDAINIAVTDTGIGIADAKVGILFDRFAQGDDSTTRKYGGSGLGLAICKELVEAMGGTIGVKTELGEGSEFWINVPLTSVETEDMTVLPRAKRAFDETKRVVIVDDLPASARTIERIVPAMNVEPMVATSGSHAIELLASLRNDGLPVDAVMIMASVKDIAADELIKRLDNNDLLTNAKCIICGDTKTEVEKLAELGFDGRIGTLISEETIFSTLHDALQIKVTIPDAKETPTTTADVLTFGHTVIAGRVLLAEDHIANQEFITAVLSEYDEVEVDVVRDGCEAVEAASNTAYDIILMDVHMPNMNGVEATRRIRRIDGLNAETPVITLTAQDGAGDQQSFLDAGMDQVLTKPLELKPLRATLRASLQRRRPVMVSNEKKQSEVS